MSFFAEELPHNYLLILFCSLFFFAEKRQTVLFSATQTRNVEDLARVSLKKAPLYVGVDDHKDTSTVEGLEQVSHWSALRNALSVSNLGSDCAACGNGCHPKKRNMCLLIVQLQISGKAPFTEQVTIIIGVAVSEYYV